ncbi:hypothetical protein H310_12881 [Aphanomyces invadans]|uniref:Transposase Tc1-like domain-containing protein n=1 Tax=Aphanomyces invadans TaxID=157072 RepID=A0A024THL8_9STRA|nr:hypothetical protein H310_12881 [Aphanomyces invadans]ETV93086.1 hypothetical protein H310_12881 [Aphanomyces invadans]|eukprot:XP_008878351.1 hypothetical protein H310_12881 [Aphanomyces invadans]
MPSSTTTKRLTDAQRTDVYIRMSLLKADGRIKHGKLKKVCDEFKVTKGALAKIWEARLRDMGGAPAFQHSTLCSLTKATGIPLTSLWRLLQTRVMKRCTSRLKPMLMEKHKNDRMMFVKSYLRTTTSGKHVWHDMLDTVHIDEKWFYVSKLNRRYYLWSDEDVPIRRC